jgi:PTS system nitrogen regulatory IIA component
MVQVPVYELSLERLILPERIFSRLPGHARRQVVRDFVDAAASSLGLDARATLAALAAYRPELPTFGPARGTAMLHACVDVLRRPAAFLARLTQPVSFRATDGEPVQIVTLVLAPTGEPSTLLRAMACLARRLRKRSVRESIHAAHDAVAIFAILTADNVSVTEDHTRSKDEPQVGRDRRA